MASITERAAARLDGEAYTESVLAEIVETITARLCLRLGVEALPAAFETIATDATVKAYRRRYYEGISSESASDAHITTAFYEDILAEYTPEIEAYKATFAEAAKRQVRFL